MDWFKSIFKGVRSTKKNLSQTVIPNGVVNERKPEGRIIIHVNADPNWEDIPTEDYCLVILPFSRKEPVYGFDHVDLEAENNSRSANPLNRILKSVVQKPDDTSETLWFVGRFRNMSPNSYGVILRTDVLSSSTVDAKIMKFVELCKINRPEVNADLYAYFAYGYMAAKFLRRFNSCKKGFDKGKEKFGLDINIHGAECTPCLWLFTEKNFYVGCTITFILKSTTLGAFVPEKPRDCRVKADELGVRLLYELEAYGATIANNLKNNSNISSELMNKQLGSNRSDRG